jgi:hypothetical protein
VQILAQGGELFYRLLEINYTLFYLEACAPLSFGYGCELRDIYDHVGVVVELYAGDVVAFYSTAEGLVMERGQQKRVVFDGEI